MENLMLPIILFSLAALPISILQIGLMLGAPWGRMAMGGQFGDVFPPKLRVSAFIQLLIILFSVLIVLVRGGVILQEYFELSRTAIWFVVVLYFISAILNTLTSSKIERMLGMPTGIVMFVSSLVVGLS